MDRPTLLNDVLKIRLSSTEPLLAYPRQGSVADFELLTARDLDLLVERAAKYYSRLGLDAVSHVYQWLYTQWHP